MSDDVIYMGKTNSFVGKLARELRLLKKDEFLSVGYNLHRMYEGLIDDAIKKAGKTPDQVEKVSTTKEDGTKTILIFLR